jgi:hypothetical protein
VKARADLRLVGLCVLLYWAGFLWAVPRGYEFSDEAFDLVLIADPFRYIGVSDFARLWHPLYLALNGDIVWFRIMGAVLLCACAAMFALSLARFADRLAGPHGSRAMIVLALGICVSWHYQTWDPTPDYNMLNLCAMLLFFSGLLGASAARGALIAPASLRRDLIQPVLLCAVGLTLMALTKATSAVLALLLGLAWLTLLPPRRPLACIALTAILTLALLSLAMIVLDGSISEFVALKMRAFEDLQHAEGADDVHGIGASVVRPFAKAWWKLGEAVLFAALLFGLGLAWSYALTAARAAKAARWTAPAIALVLAALVLWWRVDDLQGVQPFVGYRLWRLPLLLVLIAFAANILWQSRLRFDRTRLRILFAAALLALAPAAYSFGTGAILILHATGAGIFWAAALILLATLVPLPRRDHVVGAVAFLCGATSIGLLAGTMIAPGLFAAPLWQQTSEISVGARPGRIRVTPAVAVYVESFQQAAHANGFRAGTPIIGLSEKGLGLAFALGAKPLGAPWLVADGGLPTEAIRRAAVAQQVPAAIRSLGRVPAPELQQAWVLTGDPSYLEIVKTVLASNGLNFPEGYRVVSRSTRSDLPWTEVLWKPLDQAALPRRGEPMGFSRIAED